MIYIKSLFFTGASKKIFYVGLAVILIVSGFFVVGNVSADEKQGLDSAQAKYGAEFGSVENNLSKLPSLFQGLSNINSYSAMVDALGLKADVSQKSVAQNKGYVEGEVLVKFKADKINLNMANGRALVADLIATKSLSLVENLKMANISLLKITDNKTVEDKIAELKSDPNVEYAQPNYQYYPATINTNDTNSGLLWGLDNVGQTINGSYGNITGTTDADIDAPEAWAINEGMNATVVVAVIDSGVAYNHPDLLANMWDGTSCKDENGNFLGGCNHGYDYEDNDKTPLPTDSSHGTHIAGIIAAVRNNNKGIIGVAPQAKIMAIKGSSTVAEAIKGINFAKQNGAKIINASWGGSSDDLALRDAIASFPGLFIAAAGNDVTNNDGGTHFYPSDYDLDNIISVAATDQKDALASFSDYGTASVDVGAPGTNILSTIAESVMLNESFEELTPPNLPNGWVKGGDNNSWGTFDRTNSFGSAWGNVLYGDLYYPYHGNANTTITSPSYNFGNVTKSTINFWTKCDTSYHLYSEGSIFQDYMALEVSADGVNFSELKRWNEFSIDIENQSGEDSTDWAGTYYSIPIPENYLTGNFKFRLRWVTDAVDNSYDGCLVDDVNITKFSDGSDEKYDYMNGTSMAAPYVAGLAALIDGYKPELTAAQVKNIILTTGDSLSSLQGKTVTGKRINAFNALNSLTNYSISGTVKYYDGGKFVPNATVVLENGNGTQISTSTTDANGTYQFAGVAGGGDYVVKVSKDDNFSATGVTVSDLIAIKKHTLGTQLANIYEKIAADFNSDLAIAVSDLIMLKKFTLNRVEGRPRSSWKFYSSGAILTTTNYLTEGLTRNYLNLTSDKTNQDFISIKMGDVNYSW